MPRWAAHARKVFRAFICVYAGIWLVVGLVALSNLVFGVDLLGDVSSTWLDVTVFSLVAVGVLCGLMWLAGAVVAGYSEPRDGELPG